MAMKKRRYHVVFHVEAQKPHTVTRPLQSRIDQLNARHNVEPLTKYQPGALGRTVLTRVDDDGSDKYRRGNERHE